MTDTNQTKKIKKALITAILSLRHAEIATRPSSAKDADRAFESAVQYISAVIRTEKLKLLAEVRERVVGEYETEYSNLDGDAGYWEKHGRNGMREKQIANLTKLEAEL